MHVLPESDIYIILNASSGVEHCIDTDESPLSVCFAKSRAKNLSLPDERFIDTNLINDG